MNPDIKIERLEAKIRELTAERKQLKRELMKVNKQLILFEKEAERSEQRRLEEYMTNEAWHKQKKLLETHLRSVKAYNKDLQIRIGNLENALTFDSADIWKLNDYDRVRDLAKDYLSRWKKTEAENTRLKNIIRSIYYPNESRGQNK